MQADAEAMQVRSRFHQAGEAKREDLNLAADRALLALQLGLKLARSCEALLELAGERARVVMRRLAVGSCLDRSFPVQLSRRDDRARLACTVPEWAPDSSGFSDGHLTRFRMGT